jgi:hypothetical protein
MEMTWTRMAGSNLFRPRDFRTIIPPPTPTSYVRSGKNSSVAVALLGEQLWRRSTAV